MQTLGNMKPAFKKDGGSVTAGNASGINNAALFVLADAARAAKHGHNAMARLARARGALTRSVNVVVRAKASTGAVLPATSSGQLPFPGSWAKGRFRRRSWR